MSANANTSAPSEKVAQLDKEKYKGESLWVDAWRRLRRNRAALLGVGIIAFNLFIATFVGFIAPRPYAKQVLDENNVAPLWVINAFPTMLAADQVEALTPPTEWTIEVANGDKVRRGDVLATSSDGSTVVAHMGGTVYMDGATVAVTRADIAFYDIDDSWEIKLSQMDLMRPVDAGVVIATNGEDVISADARSLVDINMDAGIIRVKEQDGGYVNVSDEYALGADSLGRDLLSRILYGSRVSLAVAFVGPAVSLVVGLTVGLVSGYAGGHVDNFLMRFVDIMYAFPTILLIILLMAFFRNSFGDAEPGSFRYLMGQWDSAMGGMLFIFIGIGITSWKQLARITRGQVLSVREKEYIEAARSIGTDWFTIIRMHVLPNILGPIIVAETLTIPRYISYEAFLSFIGLGVNPPTPSWGAMISEGAEAIATYPNQTLFPAMALFFVMFAFNFLGDGLRDALDPRMRGVD